MSASSVLAAPLPATAERSRVWIVSPAFDAGFFILSSLLSIAVVVGSAAGALVPLLVTMFLAFPHYYSTFAFYLWEENRERHLARWIAFFAGPVVIVAATVSVFALKWVFLHAAVVYFWTAFHVSRQSCGILSIYRHRSGPPQEIDKRTTNRAIVVTNLWFTLWNLESYRRLHSGFQSVAEWLPRALWVGFGVAAMVTLCALAIRLYRRRTEANPPTSAELLFLFTSLAMFHPYLWVREPGLATLAMLSGHFVQYLGLVWVVHRRRFRQRETAHSERWIAAVSLNTPLLLGSIVLMGAMTWGLYFFMSRFHLDGGFEALYISLALVHYYLDALFWSFKDPHVRRTVGPYVSATVPA